MSIMRDEPVCACGHMQLVHEDDHSWCWVSTCECAEFDSKRPVIGLRG